MDYINNMEEEGYGVGMSYESDDWMPILKKTTPKFLYNIYTYDPDDFKNKLESIGGNFIIKSKHHIKRILHNSLYSFLDEFFK